MRPDTRVSRRPAFVPAWWSALLLMMCVPLWCAAEPPQRYSYYSPVAGAVNLDNRALEPELFAVRGQPLPGDLIVLTGLSRRLMRLRPDGSVVWLLDVLAGGTAYGLSSFRGRLFVAYDREVLVVNAATGAVDERIALFKASDEPLNFVRVQGNLLIAGDSSDRARIVVARLSEDSRRQLSVTVVHDFTTRTRFPRDALFLDDHTMAVADTFGHAVVLLELGMTWKEFRRHSEYYPNMLHLARDGGLYVLSEHANRVTLWDLRSGARQTVMSCPEPLFSDPFTSHRQVIAEEKFTVTRETPPRQVCATDVAGDQTLYAANGFAFDGPDRLWVADADNHRVVLFVNGRFWGSIDNVNHPVRLIPVSAL